jgi:hypothetical protein
MSQIKYNILSVIQSKYNMGRTLYLIMKWLPGLPKNHNNACQMLDGS